MKKYIKLNNNDNHLSWGNFTRIIKEFSINKTSAMQVEIFCTIFDIENISTTTVNNYCTGIRSINSEYKQKYIIYKKKYQNNKLILVNNIINLLSIIDGNIYNFSNDLETLNFINNNINLKNICLKLYNISKNDTDVNNEFSSNINNLLKNNNLYESIVNILFFIILDKKQPIYEDDIKKRIIENILSNTSISSLELEEYINLKFTEGINYNYSLSKLANNNNAYALYEIANNEYNGYVKGYPRYDKSYEYYKKASLKNHPSSYYMMAKLYINGLIGSKSNEELELAYEYLNKAIKLGNIAALNTLGLMYQNGIYPVKKDIKKAISLFEQAANKNYPYAYNNLGLIHEAKENIQESFKYFELSSSLGESWALNKVGEYYRNGIYVKKDLEKAFEYYNKAIDSPINTVSFYAYYNLAKYFYLTGNIILIKDEDTAIKYLKIASSHVIEANILLLYIYAKKYLKNKDNILYDKIKQITYNIENNPKYNSIIKQQVENNLKLIKQDNKINIKLLENI